MPIFAKNGAEPEQDRHDQVSKHYEKVKRSLLPKDGYTHVVLINGFTRYIAQFWPELDVEIGYSKTVSEVLSCMQADGYEIVDVKFQNTWDKSSMKEFWCLNTLILYK